MLTKEQWIDLARFAGVDGRLYMRGFWVPDAEYNDDVGRRWCPDSDWRDFGPLWVKLKHWLAQHQKDKRFPTMKVYEAYQDFIVAECSGTEAELMQAGCLLGAAIGATMEARGK